MVSDPCRSRFWRDSKVGVLLTMQSTEQDKDPCPQIPASFVDPQRTVKLVRGMGHASVPAEKPAAPVSAAPLELFAPVALKPTLTPGTGAPLWSFKVATKVCALPAG